MVFSSMNILKFFHHPLYQARPTFGKFVPTQRQIGFFQHSIETKGNCQDSRVVENL